MRQAVVSDIPWLLEQLKEFETFFNSSLKMYPDPKYAEEFLMAFIGEHFFTIALDDDKPVGFVAGFISGHLFNPKIRTLSEVFWWVSPEHRGSGAASMLMNEFIRYGKQHSDVIHFSLQENTPVSPNHLLIKGFKLREKCYVMEVT